MAELEDDDAEMAELEDDGSEMAEFEDDGSEMAELDDDGSEMVELDETYPEPIGEAFEFSEVSGGQTLAEALKGYYILFKELKTKQNKLRSTLDSLKSKFSLKRLFRKRRGGGVKALKRGYKKYRKFYAARK
jgi:hypothetical protein